MLTSIITLHALGYKLFASFGTRDFIIGESKANGLNIPVSRLIDFD